MPTRPHYHLCSLHLSHDCLEEVICFIPGCDPDDDIGLECAHCQTAMDEADQAYDREMDNRLERRLEAMKDEEKP